MNCRKLADGAGADSSGRGPCAPSQPRAGSLPDCAPKIARESRRCKDSRPTSSGPAQSSLRVRSGQALNCDGQANKKTTVCHHQLAGLCWSFILRHSVLIRDHKLVVHRVSEAERQAPAPTPEWPRALHLAEPGHQLPLRAVHVQEPVVPGASKRNLAPARTVFLPNLQAHIRGYRTRTRCSRRDA